MGKVIIVRLKKPAEEVTSAGVRTNGLKHIVAHIHDALHLVRNPVVLLAQGGDTLMQNRDLHIGDALGRCLIGPGALEDIGFAGHAIQTCRGIRSNAELMYSDLKQRLSGEN